VLERHGPCFPVAEHRLMFSQRIGQSPGWDLGHRPWSVASNVRCAPGVKPSLSRRVRPFAVKGIARGGLFYRACAERELPALRDAQPPRRVEHREPPGRRWRVRSAGSDDGFEIELALSELVLDRVTDLTVAA
jgi:hypothetical protein